MAKRLVKLFGFHIHDAPGEAEAECALLQQQGIVDAVLSEDVDTIMFGCTLTLRNWSSEGTRAAKTPTHVSVYDVLELGQGESGLDREGLVLVALMSGGDYIPEGVPGCGIKVACEAAKAGFGKRLCRIKRSDQDALREWREDLMTELRTNESKFFRVKHKALTIPDEFPSMEVLRYYTHPVVSQAETIERLKRELPSRREVDIAGLRAFTAETFDWVCKIGAVKFIRVLAPGLLNQALMNLSKEQLESDNPDVRECVEAKLVKSISTRRTHFNTDGTPELRISYIPNDVVGIDLDAEKDEVTSTYGRSGLALNSDDEVDEQIGDAETGPKKVFDPLQPDLVWVPETVAKLGVPLAVEDWEWKQRAKQMAKGTRKVAAKKGRKKTSDMPSGALDQYVKSTKPITQSQKQSELPASLLSSSPPPRSTQPLVRSTSSIATTTEPRQSRASKGKQPNPSKTNKSKGTATELSLDTNPWTIASSQATPKASRTRTTVSEAILISSSPVETRHLPEIVSSAPHRTTSDSRPPPSPASSTFNNFQGVQPHDDPFSTGRITATDSATAEAGPGLRKHDCPSDNSPRNPAAKRTQRNIGSAKPRPQNSSRQTARPIRAHPTVAQPSIKSFGRLSETMGRSNILPTSKSLPPDLDSDDEFEELHALCSKKRAAAGTQDVPAPNSQRLSSSSTPDPRSHNRNPPSPSRGGNGAGSTTQVPSSPPMTRVYMPRTSDAGLGYFAEVEVTREEADRMVREDALAPSGRTGRPRGFRAWRQSEIPILDLTGED